MTPATFPWPTFRRDPRNTGCSPQPGRYSGDQPWVFQTGKGIFSTPVINAQGVIYVGSADHFFYALNPDGSLRWKYETGEIIDSAAALTAQDGAPPAVTFISGDGKMVRCLLDPARPEPRKAWEFEAELRPGVSYNRWFEGNVAVGPDGTLYAGNTNFMYYAVSPDGALRWTYPTGSNNWSLAAFDSEACLYWGSLDTFIRKVSPQGKEIWRKRTLGFVAASAAIGSDGTVYIGSFDSNFYALDPASGRTRWKFATGDHIYASAGLACDAQGNTTGVYVASTDGMLYALSPDGSLRWQFDAGDPIRSSPAIGKTPDGLSQIIYFGCGNGWLYALNADGSLRWAYDTNSTDPELADRNDLNGSPALSETGVVIGGEHGKLVYVPYDYPLQAGGTGAAAGHSLPHEFCGLAYVSPGGSTRPAFPAELPASAMLTLRLLVRKDGQTIPARLYNSPLGKPKDALLVRLEPSVPLEVEHSADGRFIYIRPQEFLTPGQTYQLTVQGRAYTGGLRLGNLALGGKFYTHFSSSFQFKVPASTGRLPLEITGSHASALEWTRLAAPIPSMLPSLNQIGFDYIDWIMAPAWIGPADPQGRAKLILWAIGARKDASGQLCPDPASDFILPLSGRCQGADFVLTNRAFPMAITGITIPFNLFELRGRLEAGGATLLPAAYADTQTLAIPTFGPYLVIAGLANNWFQKLLVAGTFITRRYQGPAAQRPEAIEVAQITYRPAAARPAAPRQPGQVEAAFRLPPGVAYPLDQHRPGLLLVDPAQGQAVALDYHANLSARADSGGNLQSVSLRIPPGTALPARLQVCVMLDIFPAAWRTF